MITSDFSGLNTTELQVVLAMARNLSIGTESKIDPKGGKKCIKVPKNVSNRIDFCSTIRTRRESQCLPYAGFFGWLPSDFCRIFVMSTTSNQFESYIFRSNLTKLSMATQDYIILHSSHFPEIPGGPKCTFSSPKTFKLS